MKISHNFRPLLPKGILPIINRIRRLAEEMGCRAYLVGGFVRDILLGIKNLDVDIVIEGDALEFAKYASLKMDAALVLHKRFGTARLIMRRAPKLKIDIATARRESYKHPAALPKVVFGSIKDDLYRRDFTINAMAVSINKRDFGKLIDFFEGTKDLAAKRIKVLDEKSFIDDPTRIFRAVRFEERYDFKIDDFTARLIRNAVKAGMFDKVSGERLRTEIELLLKEKDPLRVIKRMKSLDELRFISPKIRFGTGEEAICRNIKSIAGLYGGYSSRERPFDIWLVYFMAVIDALSFSDARKICGRFMMRRADKLSIIAAKKSGRKIITLLSAKKKIKPSKIYSVLEGLTPETLLFITAKCASQLARRRISEFLKKYKTAHLLIRGADLKRLGIQPGPYFTEILKKTLYAKIDGVISTKRNEMVFARNLCL